MLLQHLVCALFFLFTKLLVISCDDKLGKDSSLTFVIDESGSMQDVITDVRNGASSIMDIVLKHKSSQIKNIVVVTFNDPERLTQLRNKTSDPDEVLAALNDIKAHNDVENDSWDEYSISGIELALKESQSKSYLFVYTDAGARDYKNAEKVKKLCQENYSQITFILTDYCTESDDIRCIVYHDIAEACSGQVLLVDKKDISEVLKYIKEIVKGETTIITTKQILPFKKTAIPFTIDDKIEHVLISVSGENAIISSMRGSHINKETVLSTSNVQVLKLNDPVPGTYEVNVVGDSQVSVMIFGRTDFVFEHGFSESRPNSLQDTTKQPFAGTNNYLSVSVNDPDHEVIIKFAQIMEVDESAILNLTLRRKSNNFYITDQFETPYRTFKIAVFGEVIKTQKGIRRIAKTPVELKIKNREPVVNISNKSKIVISYDSTLHLTCNVIAYPEPSVNWYEGTTWTVLPSKTHLVKHPYKYISDLTILNVKKSAKYYCYGTNYLASKYSSIDVTVLSPFTVDTNAKAHLSVNYGKEAVIHCKIQTSLPHRIYWSRTLNYEHVEQITSSNIYTISSDGSVLKINYMKIALQGKYTCKATLVADENKNATFDTEVKINDLAKPQIEQSKPTLTIRETAHVYIPCKIINGIPKPKIMWIFQSKASGTFQPIADSGEQIQIVSSQLSDAGHYTCTAKNELGTVQQQTELIVEAPPTFITDNKKELYVATVGDKVLRIPCKAIGYPKPVITWEAFGRPINTDNKYAVEEDGTLAIQKPVENDTNDTYICKATNKLDTASEKFHVDVTSYLIHDDHFGNSSKKYLLRGESKQIKCGLPHVNADSVRWYKNGLETNITKPFLDFISASTKYDGNYTCRVSNNLGSKSHTYEVDVGNAPRFKLNYDSSEIYWNGNNKQNLNCEDLAETKPSAVVKWTFNGKNVKGASGTQLKIFNWGNYTCELSNPHGVIQRNFTIINKDCSIDRSNAAPNMPLILTNSLTWRNLETQRQFLILKSELPLKLSCNNQASQPNYFARFSSNTEVIATCDHNNNVLVDGKVYKLSDLRCKSEVMPTVVRTGTKCLYDNTELIKVGFNVDSFVNVYEVCYDTIQHLPLFTRAKMSIINNFASVLEYKWYNYSGIGDSKSDKRYTCQNDSESCCYSKSQLISAHDVNYGPPQASTYIDHLNAIPVWQPCDKNRITWQNLEDIVRSKYDDDESEFSVWSGTSKPVTVNGAPVPRYLWKVVKSDQSNPLAMVYVNDPAPVPSDIMCENVCDDSTSPWDEISDNFTYCCRLEDFVKAFNFTINTFDVL